MFDVLTLIHTRSQSLRLSQLLSKLHHVELAQASGGDCIECLPSLMCLLAGHLKSADWNDRRAAAEVLHVAGTVPSSSSFSLTSISTTTYATESDHSPLFFF
jgi:hypothetical protein